MSLCSNSFPNEIKGAIPVPGRRNMRRQRKGDGREREVPGPTMRMGAVAEEGRRN